MLPRADESTVLSDALEKPASQLISEAILNGIDKFPVGRERSSECTKRRKDVREALKKLDTVLDKIDFFARTKDGVRDEQLVPERQAGPYRDRQVLLRRTQWVLDRYKGLLYALKTLEAHERLCRAASAPPRDRTSSSASSDVSPDLRGSCLLRRSSGSFSSAGGADAGAGPGNGRSLEPLDPSSEENVTAEYRMLIADIEQRQEHATRILSELEGTSFTVMQVFNLPFYWIASAFSFVGESIVNACAYRASSAARPKALGWAAGLS